MIKPFAKGEMGECEGERGDWSVEPLAKGKVGKSTGEGGDWLVESPSEGEVDECGMESVYYLLFLLL